MFDDYAYKKTDVRIAFKFRQEKDEPMYPWEIASFLNKLNTVYYKFELLNSICSAINHGVAASDIFILDHSLPLYERYTKMNLLSCRQAAKIFYPIGLPIPLIPTEKSYDLNLLYKTFYTINSFILSKRVQPLSTNHMVLAYDELRMNGLDNAEKLIIGLAAQKAETSYRKASLRGEPRESITNKDIEASLEKYKKKKQVLLNDLKLLGEMDDQGKSELTKSTKMVDKRRARMLLAFFDNFNSIARPLIYVRVSDNDYRVLGRSLVNKAEQTGLELKEVSKNSPLLSLLEGGIAAIQALKQEDRAKELHEIEKKKKLVELSTAEKKLEREELINQALAIELRARLEAVTKNTDVVMINQVPDSFIKQNLIKAYGIEEASASNVLYRHGLLLDKESISVINTKA